MEVGTCYYWGIADNCYGKRWDCFSQVRAEAVAGVEASACINCWHKNCTTSEILSNLLLLIYTIQFNKSTYIFYTNQIPEF